MTGRQGSSWPVRMVVHADGHRRLGASSTSPTVGRWWGYVVIGETSQTLEQTHVAALVVRLLTMLLRSIVVIPAASPCLMRRLMVVVHLIRIFQLHVVTCQIAKAFVKNSPFTPGTN